MAKFRGIQSGVVRGIPHNAAGVRMRKYLHVYSDKKRGYIARSWPKGNGGDTPARAASRELFKRVVAGMSNPNPDQKSSALALAKGTPFTWRDLMTSAAYGKLVFSIDVEGRYWIGWRVAFATIQVLLDSILNTPGVMLVRAPEGWVALLPGDDGDVLTFDSTAGIPQWVARHDDVQTILNELAPSAGDVVKFDGAAWTATDISSLYDVSGAAAAAQAAAEAYAATLFASIVIPTAANPSATAGAAAVNGTSPHFQRADAAPAIAIATPTLFGLVKPDGSTIVSTGGVLSSFSGGSGGYALGSTPSVVQVAYTTAGGNSAVFAATPTNGNLLVAMWFNPTSGGLAGGWTTQASNVAGTDFGNIATKVCGASESKTQTPATGISTTGAMVIWEIANANATDPLAFVATQGEQTSGGGSNPIVVPNTATTLGLSACCVANVATIIGGYNIGVQDVLDNSNTRRFIAGHTDISLTPSCGLIAAVNSTTFQSKSGTALVRR